MNCRGVSRRLSAYFDGQLSPAIRQSVEDHLKGCLLCRRKLAEIEAIVRVTQKLPSLRVSDGFTDRVIAATKSVSINKEAFGKISYRFGLASAAFIAAAAVVFFIIDRQPQPSIILLTLRPILNPPWSCRGSPRLSILPMIPALLYGRYPFPRISSPGTGCLMTVCFWRIRPRRSTSLFFPRSTEA